MSVCRNSERIAVFRDLAPFCAGSSHTVDTAFAPFLLSVLSRVSVGLHYRAVSCYFRNTREVFCDVIEMSDWIIKCEGLRAKKYQISHQTERSTLLWPCVTLIARTD